MAGAAGPTGRGHNGSMAKRKPGYGTQYDKTRRRMLAEQPICAICLERPATRADHVPPLSQHRHVDGAGCCVIRPSCLFCEQRQAAELGGANGGGGRRPLPGVVELVEPAGLGVDDPVWDVSWLDVLREVPDDAIWPRLMTVPHPRAVGSLWPEVAEWAAARRAVRWRWWQLLVAARLLEVDAAGRLVWETILLTVARQVGKTHWLHDICAWRLEQGARFGGPQAVLSIAKDLAVVRRMQTPSRSRALGDEEMYAVRSVNGQEGITYLPDGSEWMIRAKDSAYSLTLCFVTADEAWKIGAASIDDGVIPAMVEPEQTQLLLVSTAHRQSTSLMIGRRASALDRLFDPDPDGGLLLVEWSAPRDGDLHDPEIWRQASPHWTAKRQRVIAQRLAAAESGESDDPDEPDPIASVETQWLNRWPLRRTALPKGAPLVEAEAWVGLVTPEGASPGDLWVSVEDNYGRGACFVAVADLGDGMFEVDARLCDDRDQALAEAEALMAGWPAATELVVSPSMIVDGATKVTATDTHFGLSLVRSMVRQGRLVHDETPDLDVQLAWTRVREAPGGGLVVTAGERTDLVRALAWALRVAVHPRMLAAVH